MKLPTVCESVAGLLSSESSIASQASSILKELLNHHVDKETLCADEEQPSEVKSKASIKRSVIKSTCSIFENFLNAFDEIPNEHLLAVISTLFIKLGDTSPNYMKDIVLRLAVLMTSGGGDMSKTEHLQNCIGSAVTAMGPEKILTLVPIILRTDDLTCSNIWLVPILKNYVVGASLRCYIEHIDPLANSFLRASHKVKKSTIGKDLQAHAHGLWGLLPAFCHYPTDTYKQFGLLAELLVTYLRKHTFMHENVVVALQILVNQNKSVLSAKENDSEEKTYKEKGSIVEHRTSYSKKIATKNIRALSSHATELLQALINLFIDSISVKRSHLKDAIGGLASVSDSSVTKNIFMALLGRYQLLNEKGEPEELENKTDESIAKEQGDSSTSEKEIKRYAMIELASSLVEGAKEDLVDLIFNFLKETLKASNEIGQREAYHSLSRILEEHTWFCSSRFVELVDLLLGLKSPVDMTSLESRFACFHILIVHALKISSEDEENIKGFLILNEVILILKDLQNCIGSAVTAMGPEKILTLVPITLRTDDLTCSNIWLVPILKNYVVGASLRCYIEHIDPLANSFLRASHKVKKSAIGKDLQAHAHGLWGLLPAFCHYPTDTYKQFGAGAAGTATVLNNQPPSNPHTPTPSIEITPKTNRTLLFGNLPENITDKWLANICKFQSKAREPYNVGWGNIGKVF